MREAEPLAGRLRWGGAGQPAGSQRAEPSGRRGPGQAGRQGRWALGRVLPRAVPRWPPQPLPLLQQPLPSLGFQGQAREKQQRLRPPGVGRFREGGPSRLRVRASSDRASPALSHRDSARPGQAHPPPHPASRARVGKRPPQPRSPLLPVGPVSPPQSLAGPARTFRQPPPTASASPVSAWACAPAPAPPTPLTRPRPARLSGSRRAGARALTSHAPCCQARDGPARPRPRT